MKDRKKIICIVVLVIIFVFSYLLINRFGFINDPETQVPTGNVDIFEISYECCRDEGVNDVPETASDGSDNNGYNSEDAKRESESSRKSSKQESDSWKKDTGPNKEDKNNSEGEDWYGDKSYDEKSDSKEENSDNSNDIDKQENESGDDSQHDSSDGQDDELEDDIEDDPSIGHGEIVADDDYKIWDNMDLRIFSNPVFEFRNVIAPGSKNSYAFVVRNNNDFDILFDLIFKEENSNNINLKYKLKSEGVYLVGSENEYVSIADKKLSKIRLSAGSYKSFILDWMWVDSDNDAFVGFDPSSSYKLSIEVASR